MLLIERPSDFRSSVRLLAFMTFLSEFPLSIYSLYTRHFSAITGAYLLAQELKKLDPSEPPSVAFDQYENVFRPFVEKIQKVPWIFPGIVHPTYAWQRWILWSVISTISRVIKVVSSITWLKSKSKTRETEDDGVFKLPDYGDDGGLKMTERIEN